MTPHLQALTFVPYLMSPLTLFMCIKLIQSSPELTLTKISCFDISCLTYVTIFFQVVCTVHVVDLVVLFVCANRSSQCNKHLQSSSYTGIKSCPPSIAKSREVWYWCHYQPEPHIQHLQVNATAVGMHSQRQEIRPHCTLWSMRHDLAMQASPVNSYSFLLRTWQCAYLYHLVVPPCSCCNFSLPRDCIVLH